MGGVLLRPFGWPEAVWAVAGGGVLLLAGLVTPGDAARAVAEGADVYMFLVGMMLLSELARREGLFDALAARCVAHARGSGRRLFLWVYGVGVLVTAFMSNDATAVVLTPAVLAVSRSARAKPFPYLMACAMVANAASFVLPISNPANLVVFGDALQPLVPWLGRFALPSVCCIAATWAVLAFVFRRDLAAPIAVNIEVPRLSTSAKWSAAALAVTAICLLAASALGWPLGAPTLGVAVLACAAVLIEKREAPWALLKHVSWSVLPLVGGLFVVVEGLQRAGIVDVLAAWLRHAEGLSPAWAAVGAAVAVALVCNLVNNLPAGLLVRTLVTGAALHPLVRDALAIGVDVGPNLSITGSLATILWLTTMRREGVAVSGWAFLKVGAVAMPVALGAALLPLLI